MELSHPPLAFSVILTVASRFLHPYSTDDKTSRLMVKQFSTLRYTKRGSQSYVKKRRGRREIEATKRRRRGLKRGESNLASNQFPNCSPLSGTPREIHKVEKRSGRKQTEVTWERKGESKGERAIKPVITSLSENGY